MATTTAGTITVTVATRATGTIIAPWPLESQWTHLENILATDPNESSGNTWGTDNILNGFLVPDQTEELLELPGIRKTVGGSEDVQDTKMTDMDYNRHRTNNHRLYNRMAHTEERTIKSNVLSSFPDVRSTVSQSTNVQSTAPRHNDNRSHPERFSSQVQHPTFHQNRQPINHTPVNTMPAVIQRNSTPISMRNNNFFYTNNNMQYVGPRMIHGHPNQYTQRFTPSVRLNAVPGPQQTINYQPHTLYNYMGHNNNYAINNAYNHQGIWTPPMFTGWTPQPPGPRTRFRQAIKHVDQRYR